MIIPIFLLLSQEGVYSSVGALLRKVEGWCRQDFPQTLTIPCASSECRYDETLFHISCIFLQSCIFVLLKMSVLKLYSTLIAWKCDLLDGRCEGRWEGGSEDCRQDNPSKLSSAYDSSSCQHDETLFHIDCIYPWKLDGRCEYRWEGGSEDNPSKLSSAFAKYCILPTSSSSSLPSGLQFKQEIGEWKWFKLLARIHASHKICRRLV